MIVDQKIQKGFSHKIDQSERECLVIGRGDVTFSSCVEAMLALVNDPDYSADYKIIVDLRGINFHPSYDELMGIKDQLVSLKMYFNNKIAIVTSDVLSTVAMLVCVLLEFVDIKMKSFCKIEQAQEWIRK